ncbi:MAG: ATP-binding cassette domain-containing protein [Gammaproteobacteria bacterium]|nr:ATP-binding cassette domain-containing protein [Gammaproteobacteria bacterium]
MTILTLNNVSLAYGHVPLLAYVDFQISPGERVCLVGRNGTGKSTLFRVISEAAQPDDGQVWRKDTLRVSHLEQEVPEDTPNTIYEVVAAGLGELGRLLIDYHNTVHHAAELNSTSLHRLSTLQHRIDALDAWNIRQKVETVLSRLSLPADKRMADCSGGVRRQVMLAQALVSNPDLLLLDEPTNHMDIAAITWLEQFLLSFPGALMFVTHDRTLLEHLATRIVELDRGKLTSFPGDYQYYLRKKDELSEAEAKANAKRDKKLAAQEAWIRQGIKARRTRNEGRVRALQAMRKARRLRMETQGKAKLAVDSGDLSGRLVVDMRHVGFSYGDQCIIRDLTTRIMRGDRVGIIGPNGSGKTTLLKLILGETKPDDGEIIMGTRLRLGYFDQQRTQLMPAKTVRENISEGGDYVTVGGRSRHIIGYLRDFLFPRERIESPVKSLSGGERNRLLLAKMFTLPTNMMVLDEPTNELDVDTLELLEDMVVHYDGTLLLVSHDRTFLDNVVTSTLVFRGDGSVEEYVGGYADWIRQRKPHVARRTVVKEKADSASKQDRDKNKRSTQRQKLSYKEERELAAIPGRIEELEQEQQGLERQVSQREFYQQDKATITTTLARLDQVREELEHAYGRWGYLEGMD